MQVETNVVLTLTDLDFVTPFQSKIAVQGRVNENLWRCLETLEIIS